MFNYRWNQVKSKKGKALSFIIYDLLFIIVFLILRGSSCTIRLRSGHAFVVNNKKRRVMETLPLTIYD